MSDISVLNVRLHGSAIGTITLLPGDRSIFAFNSEYIDDQNRPTLSLSFKDEFGNLLTDQPSTGPNLLPFFSNLLPEGALRRYLAKQASVKQVRELYLLWALGHDLPGAVTIAPHDGDEWPEARDDETPERVRERREKAFRFSLAGMQLKFSALMNDNKNGGLAIPAKGVGGSWIVKLPADRFDGVPESEFSFMTIARQIGIDVPEIGLVDIKEVEGLPDGLGELRGNKAFFIRRFDRSEEGAIHIEDFAQVFRRYPEQKYDKASYRNIATVLGVETSQTDIAEFIRRLVFCTLIGNDDMHLKNWSLIYYDRHNASLAPGYDLLSTITYLPSEKAALKYARTKVMAEVDLSEFAYLADKAKLPEKLVLDTAKQTVSDFLETWGCEKRNLELAKKDIEAVDEHLAKLAIVKEA